MIDQLLAMIIPTSQQFVLKLMSFLVTIAIEVFLFNNYWTSICVVIPEKENIIVISAQRVSSVNMIWQNMPMYIVERSLLLVLNVGRHLQELRSYTGNNNK